MDPSPDGSEISIDVDRLEIGDEVVVHDAVVDQSAITGETLPVSIAVDDRIHAGSVVVRGRIVVRASAVGRDTTIGRIISRVEEARDNRAPMQTVGENFSRRFGSSTSVPTKSLVLSMFVRTARDEV